MRLKYPKMVWEVSFASKFRERMPEWILSLGLLLWGLFLLLPVNYAVYEPMHVLLSLSTVAVYSSIAIIVGSIRLIFLIINGAWRPSAHIRALGCIASSFIWSGLLVGSIVSTLPTTSVVYLMLLTFDIVSLWFAAEDAKIADIKARNKG
jgi:hypothetical protein